MGCDIHLFVEKYDYENLYNSPGKTKQEIRNEDIEQILDIDNSKTKFKKWVSADEWELDENDGYSYWYNKPFYSGRNYYLFNILAGVRSYGETELMITEPKGVPDDASEAYKYMVEQWDGDAHSHSYFLLDELLKCDWSKYDEQNVDYFYHKLLELKNIGDPSEIRIVFFFDN